MSQDRLKRRPHRLVQDLIYQLFHLRSERPLSKEDASSRITAFVYGDILILAALIALYPEDLLTSKALIYIIGTGTSTFIAHVLAEHVGVRVTAPDQATTPHLRKEAWHAVPIASAAVGPALFMTAALVGWVDPGLALQLAIIITVVRLASLGWVVGHLRGERAAPQTFILGIVLAALCLAAALLKAVITA
ncbi:MULTISPECIES: hypothetical protein [unclassified Arthrobacter]|uniref:hypothetical protein n=1 Tax=unclassified Arthrobacter TaxID=235627 RepID=UPI0002E9333E|nr:MULTISPECIES: hypothetical protein [unclassified Arthrobacter]PVE14758.1 hypothetical protein DDA93_15630 [Arthrobacter sp. Bz4]